MSRFFSPDQTKVVFFDMNNTLIDSQRSFESCFRHVLADFTGRWDDADGNWNAQQVLDDYLAAWNRNKATLHKQPQMALALQRQCLALALQPYPFPVSESFLSSFFRDVHRQTREHAVLFAHAAETIERLARRYKIGIISNGSQQHQEQIIQMLQLAPFIPTKHIFASRQTGHRKPHRQLFHHALDVMGVQPNHSVMIGDSWRNDVIGAVSCGMYAVWMCRSGNKQARRRAGQEQIAIVHDFESLQRLFQLS